MQVPGLEVVGHHVREAARVAPGRPAVWLGLRVALATAVPLVVAKWIDPVAAGWAPLAGFMVALMDKGGAYRSRATTMTAVAIGAVAAVIAGSALAGHGLVTAVVVAVGLMMCAFAQAWGPAMVSVGNTIGIQLLVAASLPCPADEIIGRALGTAGGAAFALVLALIVWPVRVYKPGRRAASAVLLALTDHARALVERPAQDPAWRDELVRRHRGIRDRIEAARAVLAATRRGRRGETGRGERLLVVVQLCDQLFGVLIGLEELLDAGSAPAIHDQITRGLSVLADGLDELARAVVIERTPPLDERPWTEPAVASADPVQHTFAAQAALMLARAHEDRALILDVVRSLEHDAEPLPAPVPLPEEQPGMRHREVVRDALDRDSVVWRHALRVGIVVAIAMAVARGLDLSHRYWVTLNVYLLLQPYGAATRTKAVQRVVGTVIGGVLAAAIPWAIGDPRFMMVLVVVLAGLSASVLQLNYGLYAMFLTPTFVLLAEVHARDVHLVGTRIINTLLGAALAVAGSLIWRAKESTRFDDQVADAFDAVAHYLDEVVHAITTSAPQPSLAIIAGRRAFGVALNHAELALDRVVAERAPTEVIEPRMTQLVFLRRLGSAITAFASTRGMGSYATHTVPIAAFGASASGALRELAAALRTHARPVARARLERAVDDPVLATRLARIDRVLATLTEAVIRAADDPAERSAMVAAA